MEYYIIEPITFLLRYLQVFAEFILIFALINRKIEIKKIFHAVPPKVTA